MNTDFTGSLINRQNGQTERSGVDIEVSGQGIKATDKDFRNFQINWENLVLEHGGATGHMWFCMPQDRSFTILCETAGFAKAIDTHANGTIRQQIASTQKSVARKKSHSRSILMICLALVITAIIFIPSALSYGSKQAVAALPPSVDESIGELGFEQMKGDLTELDNEAAQAALQKMLERLEPIAEEHYGVDWNFQIMIVDDPDTVNAFALPGGQMVFYSGLLLASETPEEVASVLAHEMGHILERHGLRRLAQSAGIVIGINLILGDVSGLVALAAEFFTISAINNYSQVQEHEADNCAVILMHKAGMDPLALSVFFKRLQEKHGELPYVMQMMSTHPSHEDRIHAVNEQATALGPFQEKTLGLDWDTILNGIKNHQSTTDEILEHSETKKPPQNKAE